MEQTKPIFNFELAKPNFNFEVDDLKEDGLYTMPVAWASSLKDYIGFIALAGIGIAKGNPDAKRQLQSAKAKLAKADEWWVNRPDATDDDLIPEEYALTGREVKTACRAIESLPILDLSTYDNYASSDPDDPWDPNSYYLEAVRTLNGLRELR